MGKRGGCLKHCRNSTFFFAASFLPITTPTALLPNPLGQALDKQRAQNPDVPELNGSSVAAFGCSWVTPRRPGESRCPPSLSEAEIRGWRQALSSRVQAPERSCSLELGCRAGKCLPHAGSEVCLPFSDTYLPSQVPTVGSF